MSSDSMPLSAADEFLKSLHDPVHGPLTQEMLDAWVVGSPERQVFLQGKILGSIRWVKELGVPASPKLLEGFVVRHDELHLEISSGLAGTVEHDEWRPSDTPATWDGQDVDTYHHVGFLCERSRLEDRITVTLASEITWHGGLPNSGPRRVVPPQQSVPTKWGSPVLLTFEVGILPVLEKQA